MVMPAPPRSFRTSYIARAIERRPLQESRVSRSVARAARRLPRSTVASGPQDSFGRPRGLFPLARAQAQSPPIGLERRVQFVARRPRGRRLRIRRLATNETFVSA